MPNTTYQILRMDVLGTPPVMNGGRPYQFDNPEEASRAAKILAKNMGEKLCVKPVINAEWKIREQIRFNNQTYRYLPWASTPWWRSDQAYAIHKDHFAHAALEKPGWISYTKSEEDGTLDKQSLLRPGAYLGKYFEAALHDYGISQAKLVTEFMCLYGPIDIKFAATEADIQDVYWFGPQTCLSNGKHYPNEIHPATVYAAGDLQVAYIGEIGKKVSARCLVWPEKKLYSRVYGDIARLTQGLLRLGYQWGAPIGARLKRVQLGPTEYRGDGETPSHCFLVPYLDKMNQQGGGFLSVIDKGDHLIIGHKNDPGSHHAGGADGYSGIYIPRDDEHPMFQCDRCEYEYRKVYEVYLDEPGDEEGGRSEMWCEDCRVGNSTKCYYSGNYFRDVRMTKVNGSWWCKYYADMYASKCQGNGKLYANRDLIEVHYPDGTAKILSGEYANLNGGLFVSDLTSRVYFKSDYTTIFDSYHRYSCSKSELRNRGFACDTCGTNWTLEHREQLFGNDKLLCPHCAMTAGQPKKQQPQYYQAPNQQSQGYQNQQSQGYQNVYLNIKQGL